MTDYAGILSYIFTGVMGGVSAYYVLRERIVRLEMWREMAEARLAKGGEMMDQIKDNIVETNMTLHEMKVLQQTMVDKISELRR